MTENRLSPVAYSAPMVTFGAFTALETWVPVAYYPLVYILKVLAVTASLMVWSGPLRDIRPRWSLVIPSALTGLVVIAAWLVLDKAVAYPHLGNRVGFDPTSMQTTGGRLAFLAVRLYGLVLLVPVMEELFWRSFLLRYLSSGNFLAVPIGRFSVQALMVMVALSALSHTEWLVAALASIIFAAWLYRSRSLFAAVVAHATANAALGAYILQAHDWKYW